MTPDARYSTRRRQYPSLDSGYIPHDQVLGMPFPTGTYEGNRRMRGNVLSDDAYRGKGAVMLRERYDSSVDRKSCYTGMPPVSAALRSITKTLIRYHGRCATLRLVERYD